MTRIITDSSAELGPEEQARLGVDCVPIPVRFGDREYRENIDMTRAEFFALLLRREHFPKTSQPAPSEFEDRFRAARDAGEECVAVLLSSALSGEYASAAAVRDELDFAGCAVVDSRNASFGQRLVVEEALRLRDRGLTAAEIGAALETFRGRVTFFACVDTMEFLCRGGRVSRVKAVAAELTRIKPLIRVTEAGEVTACGKALGYGRALHALTRRVEQEMPDLRYPVYVVYSTDRRPGQELADSLRGHGIPVEEENIRQIGSAIGAHIGPGACGVVYVRKD